MLQPPLLNGGGIARWLEGPSEPFGTLELLSFKWNQHVSVRQSGICNCLCGNDKPWIHTVLCAIISIIMRIVSSQSLDIVWYSNVVKTYWHCYGCPGLLRITITKLYSYHYFSNKNIVCEIWNLLTFSPFSPTNASLSPCRNSKSKDQWHFSYCALFSKRIGDQIWIGLLSLQGGQGGQDLPVKQSFSFSNKITWPVQHGEQLQD